MLPIGHLGQGNPWDLFFPLGDKQTFLCPIKEGHSAETSSMALQCGVASLLEGCNSFKERGDAIAGGSPQRDRRSLRRRKKDLSRGIIPDWEIAIFRVNFKDFRNNLINFPSAPFQRPCSQD